MFDFASIPLEHEYADEHKVCSVPKGVLALAESIIECAFDDVRFNRERDKALQWIFLDGGTPARS